jgi:hypothetical protein
MIPSESELTANFVDAIRMQYGQVQKLLVAK